MVAPGLNPAGSVAAVTDAASAAACASGSSTAPRATHVPVNRAAVAGAEPSGSFESLIAEWPHGALLRFASQSGSVAPSPAARSTRVGASIPASSSPVTRTSSDGIIAWVAAS
jgi:hypothetical protein